MLLFDRWHDAGMGHYDSCRDTSQMTASEALLAGFPSTFRPGGTTMVVPVDPCIEARNAALAKLTKALEGLEADTDQIVRIAEAIAKLLPVTP